jgi:Short C-terminal domain
MSMWGGAREDDGGRTPVLSVVLLFAGMAGATAALTVLFLSMRSVMKVGGFCASGGPYVIQTPCPKGVAGLLIGSIWVGLICLGLYLWETIRLRGPNLAGLAWPALFLSLGYNFLEFGLRRTEGQGLVWGWVICGIVFVLMGGIPMVAVLATLGRSHESPNRTVRASAKLLAAAQLAQAAVAATKWSWATSSGATASASSDTPDAPRAPSTNGGVVDELERLAELRHRGELSDDEYQAAKRRLLGTPEGA